MSEDVGIYPHFLLPKNKFGLIAKFSYITFINT